MERPHRPLSLHHGTGRRRLHSRLTGTRLPSRGGQTHLPPCSTHRASVFARRALASAIAPRPSRAIAGDVSHPASLLRHGYVRICLSLVSDGRSAAGNLARLPLRHRREIENRERPAPLHLQNPYSRIGCAHRALSPHRRTPRILHYPHRYSIRFSAARLRRLHLRIRESQSLVVFAVDAYRLHLLRHGLRHRRRNVALHVVEPSPRKTNRHPLPR